MRGVGAAGGEVGEPRFGVVVRGHPVQPFDRLVRHRVGQVEGPVGGSAVDPVDAVVLVDHRVVLTGLAAEESPEVVESPPARPPVERPGRPLDVVRGHVPLAERGGRVAVHLQHLRERRAVLRHHRRVPGERAGQLADRTETDPMVVAAGQQRRPGRRTQRGHVEAVVADASAGHPGQVRRLDRPAERRRLPETGVVDQHQQDVRRALRSLDVPDQAPIGNRIRQSATTTPGKRRIRDGQTGTIKTLRVRHDCALPTVRDEVRSQQSNHNGQESPNRRRTHPSPPGALSDGMPGVRLRPVSAEVS